LNALLLSCWRLFDELYFNCTRLQYIDEQKNNIFRVRVMKYRGNAIRLADGTIVGNHDLLLKIHLYNFLLMKEMIGINSEIKKAMFVYNRTRDSLPMLAGYLSRHPDMQNIKGIIGITLLNRGVRRLGFEVHHIQNPVYRAIKQAYMIPMLLMMCPERMNHGIHQGKMQPKLLIMSKNALFKRYLHGFQSPREAEGSYAFPQVR
jgi:hypothetical protein